VNRRSRTAPTHRRDDTARLALWLALIALLIAVAYAGRAGGKPDPQVLYQWSTAIGGLIQDAIVLGLVLAIARPRWSLLALRRPRALLGLAGLFVTVIVGIYVFEGIYAAIAHPGNEQGLTPSHWEPSHAAAYVVNAIVICTWVPFVEELTFRGVGYSLLERFGRWPAIVAIGVLFALSHGLVVSLPVLAVFGATLAWVRARTDSSIPGMVLHGTFNLIALVAAVVH
jgi:membrane protease YdiL (CAAX protease family)